MAYVGTKDGGLGGSPFLNGVHPTPRNKHRKAMRRLLVSYILVKFRENGFLVYFRVKKRGPFAGWLAVFRSENDNMESDFYSFRLFPVTSWW